MDCVQMYGTGNKTTKGQGNYGQLYIADGDTFTVESTDDGWKIAKVVFVAKTYTLNLTGTNVATGYLDDTYSQYIVQWPAKVNGYFVEDVEADPQQSVQFTSTNYSYIKTVIVTLVSAAPAEPIEYTVNIVDAPEGAAVTLDGQTMTDGQTYTVAKKLTTNNLSASEPAGYYAETSYDEATHTFTVTYKAYLVYTVNLTFPDGYNPNAVLMYAGGYYYNNNQIQAKTPITNSDVALYDLNGYEESVVIKDYNINATYTKSADIDYTVTLVNAPEGASVNVYGTDFTTSGTLRTNYTIDENNAYVTAPQGYEYNLTYDATSHTFTVTFQKIEYIEFVTTGLTIGNSQPYSTSKDGVSLSGTVYSQMLNLYGNWPITVSSANNIVKVVFTTSNNQINATASTGTMNNSQLTWTGSANTVVFSTSGDYYVTNIKVYLEAVEPTIYTVNFVNAPTGASATLNGQTFTENGTTEPIEKNLTTDDLSVTNVEGYLYEKAYNATTHTFTVTYKELWPKADTAYMVKNVDANLYLNLRARADKCAVLGEEPEALYFTYNYDKNAFTITNESGWYVGSHANDWNMAYNIAEYWVVKDLGNGTYAFQRQDNENKYIGFNNIDLSSSDPDRTAAFRDKGSNAHYAFTISEYVAPSNDYTFSFVDAPEGATVKIGEDTFVDGATYTATGKLTVNDIDASNADYNTTVTIEEGNVIKVVFSRNAYTVTFTGQVPEGATITIGGQTCGNGDIYYTKNTITKDDIEATYEGYEVEVAVSELVNNQATITVTYLKESTMSKTFSVASTSAAGDKYWTTFCYDRDFMLPEGYTACIVTNAAESGVLTIEELKGEKTEGGSDYYSGDTSSNYTIDPQDSQMGEHTFTYKGGSTTVKVNDCSGMYFYTGRTITCATTTGANITKIVVTALDSSYMNEELFEYTPNAPTYEFTFNGYYFYSIEIFYEGSAGQPVIPANTGILICTDEPTAAPAEITPVKDATPVDMTGNLLWGCLEDQTKDAGSDYIYKLSLNADNDEGSIGFYWGYEGGHKVDAHAGKAYLVLSAQGAKANGFRLDGTTTGIESLIQGTESAPVFNLNGQRMNTTNLPAGVYVKNGRKFIVK